MTKTKKYGLLTASSVVLIAISFFPLPIGLGTLSIFGLLGLPIFGALLLYSSIHKEEPQVTGTVSVKTTNDKYKSRFLVSLCLSLPGLLIADLSTYEQSQGSADVGFLGFIFAPILLVALIAVPAALIFGLAYLLRSKNSYERLIIFVLIAIMSFLTYYGLLSV